jgi:two-component system cell cycle sensor histidine kinase/response regulator CckA
LPERVRGDWEMEFRIVRPDGALRWIKARAYPVRDAKGQVHRLAGVSRDVTEHHRLEAQFLQAQKMEAVGRLAGGVAHDFNNLLSVILGYTGLALDEPHPGERWRSDLEEVRRAGERASELTQQLLAFSRQQVLQTKVLDLSQVVLDMEKLLRRLLGEDIELSLQTARQPALVDMGPGQVEQIIMNLAVNARDAIPHGGRLQIETEGIELSAPAAASRPGLAPGPYVVLSVADNGIGMDASTREHIFEPFFTTKEMGKGTGLGLSTVYGIVKQSKGHISLHSELGQGSTFKVYLPRTDRPTESMPVTSAAQTILRGSETILVVEDDEQVRSVTCAILRRHGYDVLNAQNGGEAFLICEQHAGTIHLLLTDAIMPRMSGRELAERLRAMRPDLRVLYLSGYTEHSVPHRGMLDAGASFLRKPSVPEALLRKVRTVLDAPG